MLEARFLTAPSGMGFGVSRHALDSLNDQRIRTSSGQFLNTIVQTSLPMKELTHVIDRL